MAEIIAIPVGALEVNCYIVWDRATGEGVIIDPGADADEIETGIVGKDVHDHVSVMPTVQNVDGCIIVLGGFTKYANIGRRPGWAGNVSHAIAPQIVDAETPLRGFNCRSQMRLYCTSNAPENRQLAGSTGNDTITAWISTVCFKTIPPFATRSIMPY